jgi:uncharacterized protein (TIGR03790 family)
MCHRLVSCKALLFGLLLLLTWPTSVNAGGGPENVLLVVNPNSPSSLCIANHYAKLRQIPDDNILYVSWDPKAESANIDAFRKQILLPILQTINKRRLGEQIDQIIYSSDFPWAIGLATDTKRFLEDMRRSQAATAESKPGEKQTPRPTEWPVTLGPVGSINGLTYLWQPVIAGSPAYFGSQINRYMRLPPLGQTDVPTAAFRGNRQYNPRGEVVASGGLRYFLSTMLAVTAGRGNSLDEVLAYLRRSAAADGTNPKGTIYFVRNKDIRSRVRQNLFPAAVLELKKLGIKADILEGTVPLNKPDVQGVTMGTATFDWKASGSTILPGAICEHFTSYGGVLTKNASQTPLSEFLRYGAAGASGTVAEPMALAQKFPSPMIQVHYARGCTLAEAFYESVQAPYQLLIVGDPLCRPWAKIPQVAVAGVKANATVHGRLMLEPSVTSTSKAIAARFDLFIDGLRVTACTPGKTLTFDTAKISDGYHELRVVAIGPPPIESQGRQIIPFHAANHGRKISATLVADSPRRADQPLSIEVSSPGSIGIAAMHGSSIVGRVTGENGTIEIPANTLGAGPVRIGITGMGAGGANTNVTADPIEVNLK